MANNVTIFIGPHVQKGSEKTHKDTSKREIRIAIPQEKVPLGPVVNIVHTGVKQLKEPKQAIDGMLKFRPTMVEPLGMRKKEWE